MINLGVEYLKSLVNQKENLQGISSIMLKVSGDAISRPHIFEVSEVIEDDGPPVKARPDKET